MNSNEYNIQNEELRYEKKWVYNKNHFHQIISKLCRSNLKFKVQHESREVNSIYFDDNKLSNVRENLEGEKNRKKLRVRWYGEENLVDEVFLEIKQKNALKTFKKRQIIKFNKKINICDFDNLNNLKKKIKINHLNNNILYPKIHIKYKRTYLVSSNNLIRATLDENIRYRKLSTFNEIFYRNFNNLILEMKYDINLDQYFRTTINQIFSRYSKNSKYVNCMIFPSRNFTT